nr:MAG TPA: hypothetical protein [Caudoviricetes sp.]
MRNSAKNKKIICCINRICPYGFSVGTLYYGKKGALIYLLVTSCFRSLYLCFILSAVISFQLGSSLHLSS